MTDREYGKLAERLAPKSRSWKNLANAFWIGGAICCIGQGLLNAFQAWGLDTKTAGCAVSISLIFLSVLLTGLSVYDDIAKLAGAGTLVPITGFANAISAPAVEFRTEGLVTGSCTKMFTIAGPVLVYGIGSSVLYGFFYWLFR